METRYGPVRAEEDVVGTKVRALADRGALRDLIDVFAASRRWTNAELEAFGRRHARSRFEREDLHSHLMGAEWTDDEAFTRLWPRRRRYHRLACLGRGVGRRPTVHHVVQPHECNGFLRATARG